MTTVNAHAIAKDIVVVIVVAAVVVAVVVAGVVVCFVFRGVTSRRTERGLSGSRKHLHRNENERQAGRHNSEVIILITTVEACFLCFCFE
jgi:lysylphosphatidylglycerol synthetase-like protein (DUF2156 family)